MITFFKFIFKIITSIDFSVIYDNIKLVIGGNKHNVPKQKRKKKNNDQQQEDISIGTKQIRFTISGFIGLIFSILSTFFTYYMVVIVPRFVNIETNIQNLNQRITPIESNVNQLNNDDGELKAKTEDLINRLNFHLLKDSVQKARNGIK